MTDKHRILPSKTERCEYYLNNYMLIADYMLNGIKHVVGSGVTCRFCGRSMPDVSFRKVAHTLPEFLGNRDIESRDECDDCNAHFSVYENDLASYIGVSRTMCLVRGKKGYPTTKFGKSKISIKDGMYEVVNYPNQKIVTYPEIGLMRVHEVKTYIPLNVYKTFVKMALSIAPMYELVDLKNTITWILNDTTPEISPLLLWHIFVPGRKPFGDTRASLLKRKHNDRNYPAFIFMLLFTNMQYQIILPHSLLDDSRSQDDYNFHFFATHGEVNPKGTPQYLATDLHHAGKITVPSHMEMRYEPPSHD